MQTLCLYGITEVQPDSWLQEQQIRNFLPSQVTEFMTTSKTKKDCPPLEIVYMYEYNMLEISIFSTAVSFLLEKK